MPAPNRRPCDIDTSMHFCPHAGCDYRGCLGLGNIRANGHPTGGPWRQWYCRACQGYCLETHGTLFHGKRLSVQRMVCVLAGLAEGLGIRATARGFEVSPTTVLQWLVDAAEPLQACTSDFLCDVHVSQRHLDELYAVIRALKPGEISEEQAIKRFERSRHWVWTAMEPVSKLRLAIEGGPRTLERAQRVGQQVVQRFAPTGVPLGLSDGFKSDLPAILGHVGLWHQPERKRAQGPAPKPPSRLDANSMDVEAVDLDADGDLDLLIAVEFRDNLILLNDGSARFSFPEAMAAFADKYHDSEDAAIADFNRDGRPDVVFVSEDDV